MRTIALVALSFAAIGMGVLSLQYPTGGGKAEPHEVEVPYGALATGGLIQANASNASITLTASLSLTSTDIFYLNNTNATGDYHARLFLRSSSGLADLVALTIGIDNGTQVPQITASLGSLTASTGSSVRLAPGSTNRIYVDHAVSLLTITSVLHVDVIVADTAAEEALTRMNLEITIT